MKNQNFERAHRPTLKAKALPDHRRLMRVAGWLVGATLLVGGLTIGLRAHAATSGPVQCTPSICGEVTAVSARQVKGKGSGVGAVGGAVLGGLAGNQFGRGSGNALLTVGGAVAGGFAGNEVEKNVKKRTVFYTSVRLGDGSVHNYTLGTQYAIGAKVSVVNGRVRAR